MRCGHAAVPDGPNHRHQRRDPSQHRFEVGARGAQPGELRVGSARSGRAFDLHVRQPYCSVDNKQKATTLACGYFNSGIRVFDIRDPAHPTEIAYFNPAGTTTASVGSNHATIGQWRAGGPDSCSAQVHLNADNGTLWSTCQDNGFLMLKFTNGVWPFPQSKTPAGEQN